MKQNLRVSVGAVVLALATLAAMIFAFLNFQQRRLFEYPDDGVAWTDTDGGAVTAWKVAPNSPGSRAGIRPGDVLLSLDGASVPRAALVQSRLWRAGIWTQVRYKLARNGEEFETRLVTSPAEKAATTENYLRAVGLIYLFIGLFIFVRRWNAPRAVHFYVFCLVSFILYSFHYSGKLDTFDWEVYWANIVAHLLAPALLLHFALVFPERGQVATRSLKLSVVYGAPLVLLLMHVSTAEKELGFIPWIGARVQLEKLELAFLGLCFLAAGCVFYKSFREAPSGVLRQQLKWLTGGTLAGTLPFLLLYIVPFLFNAQTQPWMQFSAVSLVLIPLCFGYAIIRYRLMDVDIIFKRGLAYTAATAAVAAVYFALVALIADIFHATASGPVSGMIAIVIAAFLFQPFRQWIQTRLDRFFYRDRLDYRRTLIEFGRTLTNEVRLEPLLGSVLDRISQTLLVDRLAIFLEDSEKTGTFALSRSLGVQDQPPLDLSFLNPTESPALRESCLFYESARGSGKSESVNHTLEQLGLNYFIACRFRERIVAVLGLGKTVDGDYLTSDDIELLSTMAGYVAIAIENARLYHSLEQKAAQIERLKEFHENTIESLNIGVLTVDLEDCVESWNPQMVRLFGIPRNEAIGKALSEILPSDFIAEMDSRAGDDRVHSIYKFSLFSRTGQRYVVNASFAPLVGKNGERLGRLILLDDITERIRLEEQMLQNEKLTSLGLLAAGVAHEVNTPLAVISNYIQMLGKQIPGDDPRQKTIDKIVKQTFRASEIVNNLLNFSRTGGAQFIPVNLNTVLDETLSLVQHPFKTARVTVIRNFTEDLPPVHGSTTRLQQVFLNLFMNARDAMPSGGMLEIRTTANNGSVEVEVTDTGVGIHPDNLHRIFDPFFTTKSSARGTGLGLSVSYGIVKEHAGRLEVRSTPGKGTSFRLEFPAARKAVHA